MGQGISAKLIHLRQIVETGVFQGFYQIVAVYVEALAQFIKAHTVVAQVHIDEAEKHKGVFGYCAHDLFP